MEARSRLLSLEDGAEGSWFPIFDPDQFKEEDPEATPAEYMRSEADLRLEGSLVTCLRQKIMRRVLELRKKEPKNIEPTIGVKRPYGHPLSTKKRAADGLSEKDRSQMARDEMAVGSIRKKRRLADLSSEELKEMWAEYEEDGDLQKDIAARHEISYGGLRSLFSRAKKAPSILERPARAERKAK